MGQCVEEAVQKDMSSVSEALGNSHVYEATFQYIYIYTYFEGVPFFSFSLKLGFSALNYSQGAADKYTAAPETPSPDERAVGAVSLVWQPR